MIYEAEYNEKYNWRFVESPDNVEKNPVTRRYCIAQNWATQEIRRRYGTGNFGGLKAYFMLWWRKDSLTEQKITLYERMKENGRKYMQDSKIDLRGGFRV